MQSAINKTKKPENKRRFSVSLSLFFSCTTDKSLHFLELVSMGSEEGSELSVTCDTLVLETRDILIT